MKSIEMTSEDYDGIPAVADAMTEDDLAAWALSKDPALIPVGIAMIKGLAAALEDAQGE